MNYKKEIKQFLLLFAGALLINIAYRNFIDIHLPFFVLHVTGLILIIKYGHNTK